MPVVGVLTMEVCIEHAHSLKDKRQVVKSVKERLRHKHNIAIAEIGYQDVWQSALLAAVTVSSSRLLAEQILDAVERDAANELGGMLVSAGIEWLD